MGYDGFGVKIVRSNQDLEEVSPGACLAEELVNIDKELGIIVCRSPKVKLNFIHLLKWNFILKQIK